MALERRVRWKAGAYAKMAKSFKVLVDENVHLISPKTKGPWLTLVCYERYQATVHWTFDVTDEPVTCLFCLAGERRVD